MSGRPRINSAEHVDQYPGRVVVCREPLEGNGDCQEPWSVYRGDLLVTTHPTHAEAFADAWARTHPKVTFVPIDSDTYRVVGAMPRSAVTGRYLTSADKGE